MAKILDINNNKVRVEMDSGALREYGFENFNFTPQVGNEVEVYEDTGSVLIIKKETPTQEHVLMSRQNLDDYSNKNTQSTKKRTKAFWIVLSCIVVLLIGVGVTAGVLYTSANNLDGTYYQESAFEIEKIIVKGQDVSIEALVDDQAIMFKGTNNEWGSIKETGKFDFSSKTLVSKASTVSYQVHSGKVIQFTLADGSRGDTWYPSDSVTGEQYASDFKKASSKISHDNQSTKIPDVTGQTLSAAENSLKSAGFNNFSITEENSSSIPKGEVISTNPPANSTAKKTATIQIKVSKGSKGSTTIQVPDVTGQSLQAAENTLKSAGFSVGSVTQVNSNSVSSGSVISTDPKAGTTQNKGTQINITVSKGQNMVTMPNFYGLTAAQFQTQLQSLGVPSANIVIQTQSTTNQSDDGMIYNVSQTPGTQFNPSTTTIYIYTYKYTAPASSPITKPSGSNDGGHTGNQTSSSPSSPTTGN